MGERKKDGAYLANNLSQLYGKTANKHFLNMTKAETALEVLNNNQTTASLISAEAFDRLPLEGWHHLLALLKGSEVVVVVSHRNPAAHARSWWWEMQKNKQSPEGFSDYLSHRFHPLKVLDLLEQLPVQIVGVSYETLQQRKMQMSTFIVCNVTLQPQNWDSCVLDWRAQQQEYVHANSGHALYLDIVVFARKVAIARGCKQVNVDLGGEGIRQLSLELPTSELTLDLMLANETSQWFRRTGAERPKDVSSSTVRVLDTDAITSVQEQRVVTVLGLCPLKRNEDS